jgi:Fe-S cluster biosynthesis and repair protein YggX
METIYPQLYLFLNMYKIMYVPVWPAKVCNTMAVDPKNNLWINMNFVYRDCDMKSNNIFGILFHEMFHIFLKHSIRFDNKFDEKTKTDLMNTGMMGVAHHKANIAMDLEINASMVDDGIVAEDFFTKEIPGLYNPDYVGMTWEDIYDRYGDEEYRKWLERNGVKIDEDEMKILDAIEKAAKILKDPSSTEEDKAKASKELQKTIDKILGKESEEDIQDALEKMSKTKLGDIGDIKEKIEKVIDDLYKNPSDMSEEQYEELTKDIEEMAREMEENASEIASEFDKDLDEVQRDIENMKKTFRDSMEKMRNDKKMSKHDKDAIRDKIKDSLEDVMLSDIAKEKKDKKRKERDEKREAEKKEEM